MPMNAQSGLQWNTANIATGQQFDAWQTMLQTVYGRWDVMRPVDRGFNAEISYHAMGGFQIVNCICDPCGATRNRRDIRQDDREALTIQLVLSGVESFRIDDQRIILGPGDVLIWNSTRPMGFEVTERLHKISVTMPLARLRSWLPAEWHSITSSLPGASPGAGLLSSVIKSLTPDFLAGRLRNSDALTEAVTGLLINALDIEQGSEPPSLRRGHLIIVKDHILANLADPDLSPAQIAAAKRISVRYLHVLFEDEGTTVQQYIIRQRLIRCKRELDNPKMAHRTITDIAYGWGFKNAAHFSRRFKAEFGLSPSDCRAVLSQGPLGQEMTG